ncbi:DinB family protein [Algiphilus aromaticivorans]|uniref:DinB family protein n=1 Tax=Algiphilus aromaticivorans TaxID=382454 RepID=UPI0005C132C0|nr:DinB family protein [Algiphilus aromaticivorans]
MSLLQYARRMAAYNCWMNERLYAICETLSEEERRRDMGAFFRSVHGTLNHILLADRVWMGRFLGEPFAPASLDQELYADFATLRAEREYEDARIIAWVQSLMPETLDGELRYTSMVNPEPRRYPYALTVSHFFNHQTHHRGQLTTLLMQLGRDPGVTDLIWLPGAAAGEPF